MRCSGRPSALIRRVRRSRKCLGQACGVRDHVVKASDLEDAQDGRTGHDQQHLASSARARLWISTSACSPAVSQNWVRVRSVATVPWATSSRAGPDQLPPACTRRPGPLLISALITAAGPLGGLRCDRLAQPGQPVINRLAWTLHQSRRCRSTPGRRAGSVRWSQLIRRPISQE